MVEEEEGEELVEKETIVEKVSFVDEEDEHLDDDFMTQWRTSRLRDLQNRSTTQHGMQSVKPNRRTWGTLTVVDGEGYLDAVDQSPPGTVVVVYIYDEYVCDLSNSDPAQLLMVPQSEVSCAIEDCLRQICRRHKETRFVKMHYIDAEMEPAGVPALLAYQNGDKFAGLVPIIDELPEDADLNDTTLEHLLTRYVVASCSLIWYILTSRWYRRQILR